MYHPSNLSVNFFMSKMDSMIFPVTNLHIPNITVPSSLSTQKKRPIMKETISTYIRHLLNSVTTQNIDNLKKQLLSDINENVESEQSLDEIAEELLQSFIISGTTNINNYMQILNTIWTATFRSFDMVTKESKLSQTIGNLFLNKCKNKIFINISEANILILAQKDQYDDEELDFYNKEKEKILNLIVVLCKLYSQRPIKQTDPKLIHLSALQMFPVVEIILNNYKKCQDKMKELGDPMEDCTDEEQYEHMRIMCALYSEMIYVFFYYGISQFKNDVTKVRTITSSYLINRCKEEIIPTLSEAHMVVKFRKDINFE